jgi:uncharacterized membrane protein
MPPRPLSALSVACVAITTAFVVTGPWKFGSLTVKSLATILALWLPALACGLVDRRSRVYLRELLERDIVFSRAAQMVALAALFAFTLRMTSSKFCALEVNAWDFSLSFDRPIEQTLHGNLLWSDDLRHSMLAVHCNWLLLAFVPLYAILASPWWLVAAQAGAIAGAVAALFHFVRSTARDDLEAAAIALAFLLHRSTARATQFVFVADIFYPLALFLLFSAFIRRNAARFALALLLTVSIKEDAIVPLAGLALVAAFGYRRWRSAGAILAVATAAFAFDYFVVLPGFAHWEAPVYAHEWAAFGPTPLRAAVGMLASPWLVIQRAAAGSLDLIASLAFVPLAGWPWILAALPPLLIYGSADGVALRNFTLHYSMPVLPALFVAIPFAIDRMTRGLAESRAPRRLIALVVLAASALAGTTYKLDAPRGERRAIPALVAAAGTRQLYVQGALLPHAGYGANVHVLHHQVVTRPNDALLLCQTCNPYPFGAQELAARIDALRRDSRYERLGVGHIVLFRSR